MPTPTRPTGPIQSIINGVFYKIADGQHQYGDTDFINQVLAYKFFYIRVTLKK